MMGARSYMPHRGDEVQNGTNELKAGRYCPAVWRKDKDVRGVAPKEALNSENDHPVNRYLGIPLESLVIGNKEIRLEAEKRDKLLSISSIQEYLKNSRAAMI